VAEAWPDAQAAYQFPGGSQTNQNTWQEAIDEAIGAGKLTLSPWGDGMNLEGSCPRCGHALSQFLQFKVIAPSARYFLFRPSKAPARVIENSSFNVVCSCQENHAGRPEDQTGCGWGRGLSTNISDPAN
jgi:hypothetical protein